MFKRFFSLTILFLLCFEFGCAQDIYIRNRLFNGPLSGWGDDRYAGAEALAEALGIKFEYSGRTLYLGQGPSIPEKPEGKVSVVVANGTNLPFKINQEGIVMVALGPSLEAIGARVMDNPALGTVDVFPPEERVASEAKEDGEARSPEPTSQGADLSPDPQIVGHAGEGTPRLIRLPNPNLNYYKDPETGLWGFKNANGHPTIKAQFAKVNSFTNGLAAAQVSKGTKTEISNRYQIVGGNYNDLSPSEKAQYQRGKSKTKKVIGGKWGYLNGRGQWAIAPEFDSVENFSFTQIKGQLFWAGLVRKGSKSWYIDPRGNKISDTRD